MNNEHATSVDRQHQFGDIVHSIGEQNPLAVGFGCCCCSCSSSAAVFVSDDKTTEV